MSALRLVVFPAGRGRLAQVWAIRERSPERRADPYLGYRRYSGDWDFSEAPPVDRDRLARVVNIVPSSRSKVGQAILAGDVSARLRAKRDNR